MSTGRTPGAEDAPPPTNLPALPGRPRWSTREARAAAAEWSLRQRIHGRSFWDIAHELGVSQSTVHHLVRQAIAERPPADVDTLRQVQVERLEALIAALVPHAIRRAGLPSGDVVEVPDLAVIDRIARLDARIAAYQGTEAPVKIVRPPTELEEEIARLAGIMDERAARAAAEPTT